MDADGTTGGAPMTRIKLRKRRGEWTVAVALAVIIAIGLAGCAKSLSATTDDASITARVRTLLLNDTQIGARAIQVQTDAGVVTVSGVVRTPAEEQRALDLARGVEGVRDVRSTLQVNASGG
jgi:hyperosmotically inducible protein